MAKQQVGEAGVAVGDPTGKFLIDFISGQRVRVTPEEVDAVQVFARRLVEDYGYSKEQVQTHPQHRVRARPSDQARSYPVDIAVFRAGRTEDELLMIVECKKSNRQDGEHQLRLYMDMSAAEVGVWFNGENHLYLRKIHHEDGRRTYQPLPNIPRNGQRIEDIGLYKRKDLVRPSNLKAVFRDIRNHLAGMTTGITRDEALAQEIINLLFCKLLDEQESGAEDAVNFRAGVGEPHENVQTRIRALFERVKENVFGDVFDSTDRIRLDLDSLAYVVGELQNYTIMEADRDAIGEAFEVFIGPALRGAEGQFFTPRNVIEMMVKLLDPKPGEKIIDPACGSGGFLIIALSHVWESIRDEAKRKNWTERQLAKHEFEIASDCFRGIDKDAFLSRVCKAYMALIGDGRGGIFCQNTLEPVSDWAPPLRQEVKPGTFDVVLTNPPFGKKIVVKGEKIISQFALGRKWKYNRSKASWVPSSALRDRLPPHILFLERCIQLLKPGGRIGIVLPESIFGSPSHGYIMQWLRSRLRIRAVINMPEPLFKTSGKGGTHTKVCVLIGALEDQNGHPIFMGEARWCGHDSRGNPTYHTLANGHLKLLDEVPEIAARFAQWQDDAGAFKPDHRGFPLPCEDVVNDVLIPRYYNPEIGAQMSRLGDDYRFVALADLVDQGVLSFATGIEVGKMAYGSGNVPFVRTSDISNWEIKADFKHGVSKEIYESFKAKIDVQADDILMVKDGTYLIGTTAIVMDLDLPMLFQSHLYRIRVHQAEVVSPWLLLALLNTPMVRLQIRAKQFTQDIIDTIGKRVLELAIPMPRSAEKAQRLAEECKRIIETRVRLRQEASALVGSIGSDSGNSGSQ